MKSKILKGMAWCGLLLWIMVLLGFMVLQHLMPGSRIPGRRTQSLNNIKNIALAAEYYATGHDGEFPRGTLSNENLKPEERLSWLSEILPGLDSAKLHRELNPKEAWDGPTNIEFAKFHLRVFENPEMPSSKGMVYAPTHYIGITGYGKDSALLPEKHPRAGIFGIDRVVTKEDLHQGDGASNTLLISEASADIGPWMQGGTSTIRGFSQNPYVNGPDGIGGPYSEVFHVGFADGRAVTLSKNIDPSVLEALSTYNGNENISPEDIR